MRQNITLDQLEELTQPQRIKLRQYMLKDWKAEFEYKGEKYTTELSTEDYLLSIGQMIEFLDEYSKLIEIKRYPKSEGTLDTLWHIQIDVTLRRGKELCDILWEAVKEKLNNNS